jgi:hypothetical protein
MSMRTNCSANEKADPVSVKGIFFKYQPSTGNSGLRGHIEKYHLDEFLLNAKENSWDHQLPKMKKAADASLPASLGDAGASGRPRVPFSQAALLKHLVNFIVADDQVRHVICMLSLADMVAVHQRHGMPRVSQTPPFITGGLIG